MSEGGDFPFTFGDFVQDLFPDVAKGPSNRINDKEDAKIDYYLVIFQSTKINYNVPIVHSLAALALYTILDQILNF